jgi:hypothetical protein
MSSMRPVQRLACRASIDPLRLALPNGTGVAVWHRREITDWDLGTGCDV